MRLAVTAVVVLGLSAGVTAQSSVSRSTGFGPLPSIGLPLPQIGLPLPEIGLPLPPIGLPLPPLGLSRAPMERTPALDAPHRRANSSRPAPEIEHQHRRFGQGAAFPQAPTLIYFVPTSGWPYSEAPTPPTAREARKSPTGRLRLELQPGVVPQIFVDGYYVGTLDDFNSELTLDTGPHQVEMRADGYETLRLNVQIFSDRTITYRSALKPAGTVPAPVPEVPAPPDVPPPAREMIYVIPGCYVGNVPPRDAGLPAGCDATRATTFMPPP